MDLNVLNKVAGAFLGTLLIFLLLGFFSEKALHGDEHDDVLAYALEVEDSTGGDAAAEAAEEIDYAALVASSDASKGESLFRACGACHKVEDGAKGVGPHLWQVVGRAIGGVDGYSYSAALADKGGVWDLESLSGFLKKPSEWAPGTKMSYSGMKDAQDRVNLIAYLNEAGGSNIELAAAPAETATDAVAEEAPAAEAEVTETTEAPAEAEATETVEAPAEAEATETAEAPAEAEATETTEATETAEAAAEPEATETAEAETTEAPAAPAATETTEAATEPEATEAAETEATEETTEVAVAEPAAEPEAPAGDSIYASVSAADGSKVFRQCRACHVADKEQNRVGPHLLGVVGRAVASVDGYNYSSALKGHGGEWSPERLSAYLEDPKGAVEGTKMAFRGLRKEEDRAAIIKWLNENSPSPITLP